MRLGCLAVFAMVSVSAPVAGAADFAAVKERGVLRVLSVSPSAEDEFIADGGSEERPGFDREILEGFARLHRIKLQLTVMPGWDALIPALRDGRGDVIAGRFTATESRSRLVAFTSEVFPSRNVVLTRKPRPPVLSLDEFRRQRVGTIRGTSMAEAVYATGIPRASVDDSFPAGGLPGALREGKVTAVVLGVESAIAAQVRDPALELGVFLGPPRSLAYAVRKTDAELLAALNEYVDNVRRTPTWSRLVVKYFGEAAPDILKKARTE